MRQVTIDNVSDGVTGSLGQNGEITPRQSEIMTAAIKHLHGFCKDVTLDPCRVDRTLDVPWPGWRDL